MYRNLHNYQFIYRFAADVEKLFRNIFLIETVGSTLIIVLLCHYTIKVRKYGSHNIVINSKNSLFELFSYEKDDLLNQFVGWNIQEIIHKIYIYRNQF